MDIWSPVIYVIWWFWKCFWNSLNKSEEKLNHINFLLQKIVRKVKDKLDFEHEREAQQREEESFLSDGDHPEWPPHKLCVIVPFRDRFEELMEFLPHMHRFLNAQHVRHKILVINQVDVLRWVTAQLIVLIAITFEYHDLWNNKELCILLSS